MIESRPLSKRVLQLSMFDDVPDEAPKRKRRSVKVFEGKHRVGRYLLLGGGVQSTTLARMMQVGEVEPADLVVFADTGDEPNYVYQQYWAVRQGLESAGIRVSSPMQFTGGIYHDLKRGETQGSMPLWVKNADGSIGQLKRQCTPEYKIRVSNHVVAMDMVQRGHIRLKLPWYLDADGRLSNRDNLYWLGDERMPALMPVKRAYAEMIFGISADEPTRARMDRGLSWHKPIYPLIEMRMTRDDCVRWLNDHGFPIPHKSACVQCPYRDDHSWLWMKKHDPMSFDLACEIDEFVRSAQFKGQRNGRAYRGIRGDLYVHYTCVPLRDVDFDGLISGRVKPQRSFWELETLFGSCRTDGGFSCMS